MADRGVRVRLPNGESVVAPPDQAQDAVLAGDAQLEGARVRVIGPDGTGLVDAKDLHTAISHGYRLADDAEVEDHRLQQRAAENPAWQAAAFFEGGARTLTLGLTDKIGTDVIGVDPAHLRARAGTGAATVGELGGLALAVYGGGALAGAGGIGRGVTALGARGAIAANPAMAARAGGMALARKMGIRSAAGRAVVAEGLEGAAYGAGHAVSESALWDKELTGEDLAYYMGIGGLAGVAGAGLGEGVAAAFRGGKNATGRALARVAEASSPESGGVLSKVGDMYGDPKLLSTKRGREVVMNREAVRKSATREAAEVIRPLNKELASLERKVSEVGSRMRKVEMDSTIDRNVARLRLSTTTNTISGRIKTLLDDVGGPMSLRGKSKRLVKELDHELDGFAKQAAKDNPALSYQNLDYVSSRVGGIVRQLESSGDVSAAEIAGQLRAVGRVVDDTLDDRFVFGAMADSRRAVLQAKDAVEAARSKVPSFMAEGATDPAVLQRLMRDGDVDSYTLARMDYLEEMFSKREMPQSLVKELTSIRSKLSSARSVLKKNQVDAQFLHTLDNLAEAEMRHQGIREAGNMLGAGSIAGSLLSGGGLGVGALAAAGLNIMTRPGAMVQSIARVVEATQKLGAKRSAAIGNFVQKATGAAKSAGKAARVVAPRLGRERAIEIAKQMENMTPEDLVTPSPALRQLAEFAPDTALRAQATNVRAIQFLKSKAPVPYRNQWTGAEYYDPVSMDRYARYAEAVMNPMVVWDGLAEGRLTNEHVEAVREVYPNTFRQVQYDVVDGIAGKKTTYKARVTIGTLLEVPIDPSLSIEHRQLVDQAFAPKAPEEQPLMGGTQINAAAAHQIGKRANSLTPQATSLEERRE
jgi:hypothetical protein